MKQPFRLLAALLASATAAHAAERAETSRMATVETHVTTNALDGPVAASDLVSVLRGTLSHKVAGDGAETSFSLEAQGSSHRRWTIEDDRSAAVTLEHRRRLGRVELRGTLGFSLVSEGDDLLAGAIPIGIRTDTAAASFGGEAGLDLGQGFAAIASAAGRLERSGATRFANDLIPATRLEPDAGRLAATLSLRRQHGAFLYGLTAGVSDVRFEALGVPPVSVSSRGVSGKAEIRYAAKGGVKLGASLGLERFRARNGLFDEVKPLWELAAVLPFGGAELKGSARSFFDTVDSDDPLASYVRRAELELSRPFSETIKAGIGLFGERRLNLLLENEQRTRGVYVEASYRPSKRTTILLRADWKDEFATVYETRERTFDGFLRIAWSM